MGLYVRPRGRPSALWVPDELTVDLDVLQGILVVVLVILMKKMLPKAVEHQAGPLVALVQHQAESSEAWVLAHEVLRLALPSVALEQDQREDPWRMML